MDIPEVLRQGARLGYGLKHRWLDAPALKNPRIERVRADLPLVVLPDVLPPARCFTTRALVDAIDAWVSVIQASQGMLRTLDMGTGSGAAAIALARHGAEVDAVDLSPHATRCARINAGLHGVEDRVHVFRGDLFEPVRGRRYDIIVFNPPYLDGTPEGWLSHAFYGGEDGEVLRRFFAAAPGHLAPEGRVILSYSSVADTERLERLLSAGPWRIRGKSVRDVVAEVITHYLLSWEGARNP